MPEQDWSCWLNRTLSGELTWLVLASSLNMSRASAAANAKIRFLCTVVRSLLGTLRKERGRPQLQSNERVHVFSLVLAGLCRPAWVTCHLSATHCKDNSPTRQGTALVCTPLVLGMHSGTAAQTLASAPRNRQQGGGGGSHCRAHKAELCACQVTQKGWQLKK